MSICNPGDLIALDRTVDFNALKEAAYQCSRGIKWKQSTIDFLNNVNYRCNHISDRIWKEGYNPSKYNTFSITEPKPRKINSAPLEDRIIQRVMCNESVYHDLTRFLNVNNAACQLDRGVSYARNRLMHHLYTYSRIFGHKGYVLRIDIHKFFDNISHGELKAIVYDHVCNPAYQDHLYSLIDSFKTPSIDCTYKSEDAGIPLGSQLSQLFALAALHSIDEYIQRELRCEFYIRYMDDLVIIFPDINVLKIFARLIIGRLECMGYETNRKTHIGKLTDGVLFLHTRYFLTKTGKIIRRLERSRFTGERRKLRRMFYALAYKRNKHITLGIILRHYQGWRSGVIQQVGETAVYDMDCLFLRYLQGRHPDLIIGPDELEGLSPKFIKKFCSSSMKPPISNALILNIPMKSYHFNTRL